MRVQYVEDLSYTTDLNEGNDTLTISAGSSSNVVVGWIRHIRGQSSNRGVYSVQVSYGASADSENTIMYVYDIPNGVPIPLPAPLRKVGYDLGGLKIRALSLGRIDGSSGSALQPTLALQIFGTENLTLSRS